LTDLFQSTRDKMHTAWSTMTGYSDWGCGIVPSVSTDLLGGRLGLLLIHPRNLGGVFGEIR